MARGNWFPGIGSRIAVVAPDPGPAGDGELLTEDGFSLLTEGGDSLLI